MPSLKSSWGQSIIEMLIALGIGAIFMIGIIALVAPAIKTRAQASKVEVTVAAASEMMDNVRDVADANWNTILGLATGTANKYYFNTTSSPFTVSAGTQSVTLGTTTVTRYFYLTDAYRDNSGNLTSSVVNYDPSTKIANVVYGLISGSTSTLSTYITRNLNLGYAQNDWSGATGDAGPNTFVSNTYFSASSSLDTTFVHQLTLDNATASGTLQSATFDTGVASGSILNSVTWVGNGPAGTSVGFQFAVATSSAGPWSFKGSDGTSATWFTGNSGSSTALISSANSYTLFNGFRYFRYQVTLFPDSGHTVFPTVNKISVNWSP